MEAERSIVLVVLHAGEQRRRLNEPDVRPDPPLQLPGDASLGKGRGQRAKIVLRALSTDHRTLISSPEEPQHDEDQDDHQKDVDHLSGLRKSRNSPGAEIPQKPQHQQYDDQNFEHDITS